MGLGAPWYKYHEIIALQPVKKLQGMDPMGLNAHWDDYLEMIYLQSVKKCKVLTQWNLVPLGPTLNHH